MVAAEIKIFFYFVVGVFVSVLLYQLGRSIYHFLQNDAPEMGVIYPIIFSPIISIPLGVTEFFVVKIVLSMRETDFSAKKWFLSGCFVSFLLPLLDICIFLKRVYF